MMRKYLRRDRAPTRLQWAGIAAASTDCHTTAAASVSLGTAAFVVLRCCVSSVCRVLMFVAVSLCSVRPCPAVALRSCLAPTQTATAEAAASHVRLTTARDLKSLLNQLALRPPARLPLPRDARVHLRTLLRVRLCSEHSAPQVAQVRVSSLRTQAERASRVCGQLFCR